MFDYTQEPKEKIDRINKLEKDNKPIISVVTAFYNAGKTINETADSLLSQTFPFFEWIIVDDGSKDQESLKVLEQLKKRDKRIKVYHKENGGPSLARDFGIKKMSKDTKYYIALDSDDLIEPTFLEVLYFSMETHPEVSFAYTSIVNFGDDEFIWDKHLTIEDELKENLITVTALIKKEDLLEVNGYGIKEKNVYEDWNLWLKLIAKGKIPMHIPDCLFWYRKSGSGELSRANNAKENAMRYINETVATINNYPEVVEFPRHYTGRKNMSNIEKTILPQYQENEKTKILFLIPWMVVGGADIFNLDIIKRLDKEKYETYVVSTIPAKNSNLKQELKKYSDGVYDLSLFLDPCDYPLFVNYLIKSRNISKLFISNSSYGFSMLPLIKKENPNVAVMNYVHSVDNKDKYGAYGAYTKNFEKYIDKTLTCNNFTKDELINRFRCKNVETLYIGTDSEKFDPKKFDKNKLREDYSIPKDKKLITFLARIEEEKRPDLFLEVARNLLSHRKDIMFMMAGYGSMSPYIKKLIKKYNLSNNFIFYGPTNKSEEIYAISDVFVICSRLEGLALTAFESLAMGVPVVSCDVGGQPELVGNDVGALVHYDKNKPLKDDILAYSNAIENVLENMDNIKPNTRKKILDKFDLNNSVKQLENQLIKLNPKKIGDYDDAYHIYETYLRILEDEYKWLCSEFKLYNYGINIYAEVEIDPTSKKQVLKKKFKDFCYKYNITNEGKILLNFVRHCVNLIRTICYVIVYFLKAIYSVFIILFKILYRTIRR